MATDIGRVTAVKDNDGTLLTGGAEVKDRWLDYFNDLLNVENEREDLEGRKEGRKEGNLYLAKYT